MKMKTIQATLDPAPPVVKFVANVWHQAHKRDASRISLTVDDGKFKLIVDDQVYDPLPASLFPHFVREFLRYSKTTVWRWTTRIKTRQCRVEAGNACLGWVMISDNIKSNLTIERDREQKGQMPDLLKLNMVLEGSGAVWMRNIKVLQAPLQ